MVYAEVQRCDMQLSGVFAHPTQKIVMLMLMLMLMLVRQTW